VKNPSVIPPIPNQCLKQKEAEALAQWLIPKVAGK